MVSKIDNSVLRPLISTEQINSSSVNSVKKSTDFKDLLLNKLSSNDKSVKFSKHALERMQSRDLKLSDEQIKKIEDYVDKAAQKGSKESVFVLDGMSMVMSIDNRTVITCMDAKDMQENILTNVDSVAFLY